jgi:hypothetical protein
MSWVSPLQTPPALPVSAYPGCGYNQGAVLSDGEPQSRYQIVVLAHLEGVVAVVGVL